ncbi:MAG: TIR domain-containing protein [Pseudomonadota bacterium]
MSHKYRSFISYSHRDKKWGDWLHRRLERYRIPKVLVGKETRFGPVPPKIFPVFRDREELPTSSDLSLAIQSALNSSQTLIVICSPNSAKSKWVNEEILAFKRMHGEDNILAIIVDGEPNGSEKPGYEDIECFPNALRFKMGKSGKLTKSRTEPIAADVREAADGKDNALLKLIAGVLAVDFNDLKQREVAEERKRTRRAQLLAACMGVMAVAAAGAGWFAWDQRNKAEAALRSATDAANTMVFDLAHEFRDSSVPGGIIIGILNKARSLQDELNVHFKDDPYLDRSRAISLSELGELYQQHDSEDAAMNLLLESERIFRNLTKLDPENVTGQKDMSRILGLIGDLNRRMGRHSIAMSNFHESIDIDRRLVALKPEDPAGYQNLSVGSIKLGDIWLEVGKTTEAIKSYDNALSLARNLVSLRPSDLELQRNLATILDRLGDGWTKAKETEKAMSAYEESLDLFRKILVSKPKNTQWLYDIALTLNSLGNLYYATSQDELAIKHFEESLDVRQQLVALDRDNIDWQISLVVASRKIAIVDPERKYFLIDALNILKQLHSEGKLPASYFSWIATLETEIAN